MCSAAGGTIQIRPAPPDTEIPNSSFLIPNDIDSELLTHKTGGFRSS